MAGDTIRPREYITRRIEGPRLNAIAELLARAGRCPAVGRGRVHAPRALQSWPGIVHGGGAVALLDAVAVTAGAARGPRLIEARLTASLPIETDLDLDLAVQPGEGGAALAVLDAGQPLASATVRPLPPRAAAPPAWRGGADGAALPVSEDCLACGARNAVGLQASLGFDDVGVWARLVPRAPWRGPDGRVHPALAPVLLDELAWWLGALVAGEGGLTNRITVALHEPDAPCGDALIAAGRFADVTPVDRKRTFWRTESALVTGDGALVATASIVFRGGAEYSARQMAYFRARTPAGVFRRMFPNHAPAS
jgi:hypothetical protein